MLMRKKKLRRTNPGNLFKLAISEWDWSSSSESSSSEDEWEKEHKQGECLMEGNSLKGNYSLTNHISSSPLQERRQVGQNRRGRLL